MKASHTVALALVGWYLMVPPLKQSWSWTDDVRYWIEELPGILPPGRTPLTIPDKCTPSAPLPEWKEVGEYEALSDCKQGQEKAQDKTREQIESVDKALQKAFKDVGPSKTEKSRNEEEIRCALCARCIATDDPRLKGN